MIGRMAFLVVVAALPCAGTVWADNPGAGELQKCKICHTLDKSGANRVGPNLFGVFGRKAGTVPGFNYSDAVKQSGVTWDNDTLTRFLLDPKATIPGNRMSFPGITDDAALSDLLMKLKQATE